MYFSWLIIGLRGIIIRNNSGTINHKNTAKLLYYLHLEQIMLNYYLSYYIFIGVLVRYLCINTQMLYSSNDISWYPNLEFSATIFTRNLRVRFARCEVNLKFVRRAGTTCTIQYLSVLNSATGTTN